MKTITLLSLSLILFLFSNAQDETPKKEVLLGEVSTTSQSLNIDGNSIQLTVESGTQQLRDENDKPIALFGYTSYVKDDDKTSSDRPIVFAFNGGPLSASIWLHIGILGPQRIVVNDPGHSPGPPYQMVNNEESILDLADLVMIDPVGVGLSKPTGDAKFEDFWGVDQDIRSIGLFIEQYLIKNSRMNSPKYLLGESYGTFRNAGLMKYLQDKGITLNGVIMVSAVFNLSQLFFPTGSDMSYMVHFPTYAASAWYHDKLPSKNPDIDKFLEEVRAFTEFEYVPAMLRGDQLGLEEKTKMANRLSSFSGISPEYWLKADLRINSAEFFQELLRDEGKTIGRLDSRFQGINNDLLSQFAQHDPTAHAIGGPFISAFKNYLYTDLGVNKDLTYTIMAFGREGFKWDWKHKGNIAWNAQVAISTMEDMKTAMSQNPNLKVLILNGYYDLATPFYGVEYTINHMGLTPEIKNNFSMKYFEAGHMMYTHEPSRLKFKEDVKEFILSTLK